MWQPNRSQWRIIWAIAILLVLLWPPAEGQPLAIKAIHAAVDPAGSLPAFPEPLPMGLGDDGFAVAEHDAQEAEYYRALDGPPMMRMRLKVRDWVSPIEAGTLRQLLIGLAVLSVLGVWKLGAPRQASAGSEPKA